MWKAIQPIRRNDIENIIFLFFRYANEPFRSTSRHCRRKKMWLNHAVNMIFYNIYIRFEILTATVWNFSKTS